MTRNARLCSLALAGLLLPALSLPAAAQGSTDGRIQISINAGALAGSKFTQTGELDQNAETGSFASENSPKTGAAFDVGAAVRIAGRLWVQAAFTSASPKSDARISASIPHPILFDQPRTVQGTSSASRTERDVHVDIAFRLPLRAIDIKVMAGPTFASVKQDLVTSINYSQTYPFDAATFTSAAMKKVSKSAVGFNAGADLSRALNRRVGFGALIRYSTATVKLSDPNTGDASVKGGGIEATGGLRFWF